MIRPLAYVGGADRIIQAVSHVAPRPLMGAILPRLENVGIRGTTPNLRSA
jgi:hypothetical protein